MEQKLDIFSVLKDINLTKSFKLQNDENFNKAYDSFMINRYLSMNPETVLEANCMNKYNRLPKNVQYLFYCSVIEKKDRFLKYIKSDASKEDKDLIKYVQKLYQVNKIVAEDIVKTIPKEEKDLIIDMFEQKTIRKR